MTHDISHRMDEMLYHSWQNAEFMEALEDCAEKAYPMKQEIESWFRSGGKYEGEYALMDIFHALFLGNLQVPLARPENYYIEDEKTLPAEIFADLSSIRARGCMEDILLNNLFKIFDRMVQM